MTRQVVIIGAGPAGLAAAAAALRGGAEVTLVDAADQAGGQFHRMPPDVYDAVRPFRGRLERCTWWPDSTVWSLERHDEDRPPRVHVVRGLVDGAGRRRHVLEPDALILAPGAHDRVLPFPGWELPGVVTAGAAQALVKGERLVIGDRVLVAGSGPFLLPVAASLLDAGAGVLQVLEANPAATVLRGWARRPWERAARTGKAGRARRVHRPARPAPRPIPHRARRRRGARRRTRRGDRHRAPACRLVGGTRHRARPGRRRGLRHPRVQPAAGAARRRRLRAARRLRRGR